MNKATARLFALAMTFSAVSTTYAARRYQVVNLDDAVGRQVSPFAINNAGVIALRAFENGNVVSFLYDSKTAQIVERFPVENGFINAISNNGNVAGEGTFATVGWFVVNGVAGTVPFPGGTSSGAVGINNRGDVAGFITFADGFGSSHAVVYSSRTGELNDLGTFGGTSSVAFAVNERGQATGWANLPGSPFGAPQHAFRFDGQVMEDLGTLPDRDTSLGLAIDQRGRVAGYSESSHADNSDRHAFLFDDDGMHDLGTLGARNASEAKAMNNHGDAVGNSSFGALDTAHAVLFSNGQVIDLNDLAPGTDGFVHQEARGINDGGAIVGVSFNPETFGFRSFLLLPYR